MKDVQIRPEGPPRTASLQTSHQHTINQVSASDIQAFHKCPRKFYLQRVLRLGELTDRSPTKASNRGSIIHLLLEWGTSDQAEALFARKQVSEQDARNMLAIVENFQSSHFMQQLQNSKKLVKEQAFYLRLSKEEQTPRYLKGFIDAMAWQDDDNLLIVDYKTGTAQADIEGYQLQADCYALAGLAQGASQVEVCMVRPEVTDNKGEPEAFRFKYDTTQKELLRQALLKIIEAMKSAQHASLDAVDPEHCKAFCTIPTELCERKIELAK